MSEEDRIRYDRILNGIRKAQRQMLERKAKLGESVVYADAQGNPYVITAEEALRQIQKKEQEK